MAKPFKYAGKNEAPVYESISNNKGVKIINRLLKHIKMHYEIIRLTKKRDIITL